MLRTLFKADLSPILTIERTVQIAPWSEETFKMCMQSQYNGWVVEVENQVVGFLIAAISEECHVLNLGVHYTHQHQGWGRKLLAAALDYAKQQGVSIAYLEVRRSNSRAISLYRKMDFHLVGERKDYYQTVSGREDALIFAKSLYGHEARL